ncbi:hypothetical protein TUM19329_04990 [Legionella antarctica]|uniref:F-box domain-containing protein n=1 Tax=Legionella antarctica TaxID=2708020 RepID=A0A6F8T174_9GAMM|nr:F-box protein [Legionella antarctica]BCA94138.1 hypothetical protein TUM19329_04990 [Legionella antarctica]
MKSNEISRNKLDKLSHLPEPLISGVVSHLDLKGIANLAQVSSKMNSIVKRNVSKYELIFSKKNGVEETIPGTYSEIIKKLDLITTKERRLLELKNTITYKFKEKCLDDNLCLNQCATTNEDKALNLGVLLTLAVALPSTMSIFPLANYLGANGVCIGMSTVIGTVGCGMGTSFFCSRKIKTMEKEINQLNTESKDTPVSLSMTV